MGYFRFIKLNLRPNRDIIIYINTSKEGIKMRYLKKVFSIFLALVLSITMLSSYVMTLKADNNVINLNELEPFKGRTKEEVTEKYDIAKKDELVLCQDFGLHKYEKFN